MSREKIQENIQKITDIEDGLNKFWESESDDFKEKKKEIYEQIINLIDDRRRKWELIQSIDSQYNSIKQNMENGDIQNMRYFIETFYGYFLNYQQNYSDKVDGDMRKFMESIRDYVNDTKDDLEFYYQRIEYLESLSRKAMEETNYEYIMGVRNEISDIKDLQFALHGEVLNSFLETEKNRIVDNIDRYLVNLKRTEINDIIPIMRNLQDPPISQDVLKYYLSELDRLLEELNDPLYEKLKSEMETELIELKESIRDELTKRLDAAEEEARIKLETIQKDAEGEEFMTKMIDALQGTSFHQRDFKINKL